MSFDEIYKTYWQKIFRLCMGYINDHDTAKDMAQETLIRVWKNLPKLKEQAHVGTWIYRIATNVCLRQIETEKRIIVTDFPPQIAAEIEVTKDREIEFLYKCIAQLPEIDRIIISLELEEVKQSEIASIVGLSEINVRVKILRIKEKLTKAFEKYER